MLDLTEVGFKKAVAKPANSDIKTTPIPILGKKYFLSYKKPHL